MFPLVFVQLTSGVCTHLFWDFYDWRKQDDFNSKTQFDRVDELKENMEDAKNAMIEGIESLVNRNEKIALTVRKVEQMSIESSNYKKTVSTSI